jgi:hypothetical protein
MICFSLLCLRRSLSGGVHLFAGAPFSIRNKMCLNVPLSFGSEINNACDCPRTHRACFVHRARRTIPHNRTIKPFKKGFNPPPLPLANYPRAILGGRSGTVNNAGQSCQARKRSTGRANIYIELVRHGTKSDSPSHPVGGARRDRARRGRGVGGSGGPLRTAGDAERVRSED